MKHTLQKNLTNYDHVENVRKKKGQEKLEDKVLGRERKIGKVLGDIGYYLVYLERPNSDYPHLVNILAMAGVNVGDINHSRKFIANWSKVCGEVVKGKVMKHFQTELPQTGRRPPAKVICDSVNNGHKTSSL